MTAGIGRRLTAVTTLAAFLLALTGGVVPAAAQDEKPKPRIAVLEFEPVDVTDAEAAAVTDQLRNDLVNLRVFTVLDRTQTEKVLNEMAFQQEGLTEADQAVRVGKLLNVEFITTGRVTRLSGAYQVNVQMIRVQTAEIVRSENVLYRGNDIVGLLQDNMATVATRLAQVEEPKATPPPKAAEAPPEKAPEPKPEPAVGEKPSWPLWLGGIALLGGVALEMSAISTNDDAETKAKASREQNDPTLYEQAQSDRDDAESQQTTALVVGGIGAALLLYYMLSDPPATETAGMSAPAPLRVDVQPGGVYAGYAWRF